MSHFPVTHYRLFNDPFDRFFNDQLHLFDPWRDFDTFPTALSTIPNSFRWINEPRRSAFSRSSFHSSGNNTLAPTISTSIVPALSEKFRVQLNVAGFNPETIRTRVEGRKVIVEAKQEDRQSAGDYSLREIRKTYDLPEHADEANLASFVTPNNMLVVEVPVNPPRLERRPSQTIADTQALAHFGAFRDPLFDYPGFIASPDFRPRIVDASGQKKIQLSIGMRNYRPEQIKVSVKNNELVVQGENNYNDNNRSERSFFTKSISLPPGTNVDQIQSFLNNDGQLEIEAPFIEPNTQGASRSIEVKHEHR